MILQLPQVDGALQSIRRMARAVEQMLRDVLDAYTQRDAELAMEVRNRDQDIDQMYNAPARTGDEAMTVFVEVSPDPAVLDWMLPGVSGIEICRQMKRQSDTREVPVIMLSARTEEADRARRLETGADDYVTKPYQALFSRRTGGSHPRATPPDAACPTEFRLLATLIEKPGRVWSREQLLDHVWGRDIYRR